MIPLLWRAQEQNGGWVPEAAIRHVADLLGMALIRVLEVATFYTMFLLEPVREEGARPGLRHHALHAARRRSDLFDVCKQRIDHEPIHVSADGKFSWEEVECLGACVNAPMVQI